MTSPDAGYWAQGCNWWKERILHPPLGALETSLSRELPSIINKSWGGGRGGAINMEAIRWEPFESH